MRNLINSAIFTQRNADDKSSPDCRSKTGANIKEMFLAVILCASACEATKPRNSKR